MNNSMNGPLRTVQDYALEVSRGRVNGAKPIQGIGRLVTAGAVTNNIIWPNGAFNIPLITGDTVSIVSSSDQDKPGGTGIRSIEMHYVDVDLAEKSITIDLNGVTPVASFLTGVRFIQCLHVHTAGSGAAAAGLIEVYREGAPTIIFSLIEVAAVRCTSSARMVPAGKQLMLLGAVGSSVSGTAAAGTNVEIVATELDSHQYIDPYIFIPYPSIGVQDGSEAYTFPTPGKFKPGTILAMRATTDKSSVISGDWFGILEDLVE